MSGRVIVPGAADSIIRGSGVWNLSGYFAGQYGTAGSLFTPYAIEPAGDGAIVAGGLVVGGLQKACVLRLSATGSVLWATVLQDGANQSAAYMLATDSAGNIGVTGVYKPGVPAETLIAKLSSAGALLWVNTYASGSGYTAPGGIVFDSAGNMYVAANDSALTTALWKFDSAGVQQWQRSINNGSNTWLSALALNSAETVVYALNQIGFAGYSAAAGATVQTVRYDPSVPLNSRFLRSMIISGDVAYLAGYVNNTGALGAGILFAAVDLAGPALLWDRHIGGGAFALGGALLECWQIADYGGTLYAVGNGAIGGGDILLYPAAVNKATGAAQWVRQIAYTAGGSNQQLSAAGASQAGLWLGWSSSVSPWGGGNIDLLPPDATDWPATLSGGAFTVSAPALVSSAPGSTLSSPAWGNGAGTYTPSVNALAASAATVPATLYPVS